MLVTNWTMRRFHIATFLVLICARLTPCMPVNLGRPPMNSTPQQQQDTAESPAADSTHPTAPATQQNQIPSGEQGIYFQGDIRLLPSDDPYDLYRAVFKRMAFDIEGSGSSMELDYDSLSSRLWPDGRVPYRFALSLKMEYRSYFVQAMAEWSSSLCIEFVQIGDIDITEEDYIVFTDSAGCSSYVGRIGGPQEVSIDQECRTKGHAMHELGHALGLWHEHSRWDRDKYIRVVRENIRDNAYYNFGTIAEEKWNFNTDDVVEYDLLSIMHYEAKSFSKNGEDTIEIVIRVPECALNQMGQRRMLSRKDKIKTSRMYQCQNKTNPPEENCQIDYDPPTTPPTTEPTPTPPPNDKLFNEDRMRLNTNVLTNSSLLCTDHRCYTESCDYYPFLDELYCDERIDFTIRQYEQKKNQRIKNGSLIVLQSLHKASRWLQCSGHNICSISDCPENNGINASNVSECHDQRFKIVSLKNALKDGDSFRLKHEFNETYLYCNSKWCDLLPECEEGDVEFESDNHDEVFCHTPTDFYVEKLYS